MTEGTMSNVADAAQECATTGATAIADATRDTLNHGVARARDLAVSAGDWTADAADPISANSVRGYHAAKDIVRAQPLLAIGVALAAGLALAALLYRRE